MGEFFCYLFSKFHLCPDGNSAPITKFSESTETLLSNSESTFNGKK